MKEFSYLQEINEDSIWDSYKKVIPYAIKEVKTESLQPATLQMLTRFSGRLFLEVQEERKETSRQQTIANEKLDDLKSLVFDLKAEIDSLRKELHRIRNESMQSHQSCIIKSLND